MDMSLRKLQELWWTGRPDMLWFMRSQRVGHDWATKLNWTEETLGAWWLQGRRRHCLSSQSEGAWVFPDNQGEKTKFWAPNGRHPQWQGELEKSALSRQRETISEFICWSAWAWWQNKTVPPKNSCPRLALRRAVWIYTFHDAQHKPFYQTNSPPLEKVSSSLLLWKYFNFCSSNYPSIKQFKYFLSPQIKL